MGQRKSVWIHGQSKGPLEIPQVCILTDARMSGYAVGALLVVEIMLALWNTIWGRKVTSTPLAIVLSIVAFAIAFGVARRVQVSKLFPAQRT